LRIIFGFSGWSYRSGGARNKPSISTPIDNKAADFSAALFSALLEAPDLPARAKSDTYADRSNTNADAGATTVIAIVVVSAISHIALARSIVIAIAVFLLNDDAPTATRAVAAATLIADQANIFDTAIR
jgi:hypothetical protein